MSSKFQMMLQEVLDRTPHLNAISLTDRQGAMISSLPPSKREALTYLQVYGDFGAQKISPLVKSFTVQGENGSWMSWRFIVDQEHYTLWAWWVGDTPSAVMKRTLVELAQRVHPFLL